MVNKGWIYLFISSTCFGPLCSSSFILFVLYFLYIHINLCIKPLTPKSGHFFYPQSNYLNKVDRGPLSDATNQISRLLGLVASDNFLCFSYKSLCKKVSEYKTCDSLEGHNLNKLGRGLLCNATL